MTRKRKNVENESEERPPAYPKFPKKERRGNGCYMEQKFEKMYGKVGGGDGVAGIGEEFVSNDREKMQYPKELVSYLKNIVEAINENEEQEEMFTKCLEECRGQECTLLMFKDSCLVLEQIFGRSSSGASEFLCNLGSSKHRKLLDLFFHGAAARTIEKLIYSCSPLSDNRVLELLNKFIELLGDNWTDAVSSQSTCFLLRAIVRICTGLGPKPEKPGIPEVPKFANADMKNNLLSLFNRIADLALCDITEPFLDQNCCSLLVQEILHCDSFTKSGKCDQFLELALKSSRLSDSLTGKNSSRIWEKAFAGCTEDQRKAFWEAAQNEIPALSSHPIANFPCQQFIASIESVELGDAVFGALAEHIPKYVLEQKVGVVAALVRCKKSPEFEETLIKELRKNFNSSKPSNKSHFLLNVLTSNRYLGVTFNVEDSTVSGIQLLEALLQLEKVKTLTTCLKELSVDQIRKMALNKHAARVLQAALRSPTVDKHVKKYICSAFKGCWNELISNPVGSHTFDSIWDCSAFDIDDKIKFMKSYDHTKHSGQGWKFAMLRCDHRLFRNDQKAWREKMKRWKKADSC